MYEGEYKNGQKEGEGIFTWPDGKVYKGGWQEGKQHGCGEVIFDGVSTKSVWKHGVRCD